MKKIVADKIQVSFEKDGYKYKIVSFGNTFIFIRSGKKVDSKITDIIYIDESTNAVKRIRKNLNPKSTKEEVYLTSLEKDKIVNDIFKEVNDNNLAKDIYDINRIKELSKSSYINVIASNGFIGLSTNVKRLSDNKYSIDIIDMNTIDIIGVIAVIDSDVTIDISDDKLRDVLNLLNKILCRFSNKQIEKKNQEIKIKELIPNS